MARRFEQAGATVHITGTRSSADDYGDTDLTGLVFHQLDVAEATHSATKYCELARC